MAAHARLKNELTEDGKYHNLMSWLVCVLCVLIRKTDEADGRTRSLTPRKNVAGREDRTRVRPHTKWTRIRPIFFFFFFYLGFTARQDYFTNFEPSQYLGGAKTRDPLRKNT